MSLPTNILFADEAPTMARNPSQLWKRSSHLPFFTRGGNIVSHSFSFALPSSRKGDPSENDLVFIWCHILTHLTSCFFEPWLHLRTSIYVSYFNCCWFEVCSWPIVAAPPPPRIQIWRSETQKSTHLWHLKKTNWRWIRYSAQKNLAGLQSHSSMTSRSCLWLPQHIS